MGWILTSKKKQTREKLEAQEKAQAGAIENPAKRQNWDPGKTLLRTRVAVGAVSVLALSAGWYWTTGALERYVQAQIEKEDAPVVDVTLANAPAWMSQDLREELEAAVAQKVSGNPLAGAELREARASFAQNPWVDSVKRVRRATGGAVLVEANFRQPIAVVEQADTLRLVDGRGILLPGVYSIGEEAKLGLPVIRGVNSQRPEADGVPWNAPELLAGIAMIKRLADQPYYNQIVGYDVGRRDPRGRVRISLVTLDGQIDWGLPIGQEQSIEPDADHKLKLVSSLFQANAADPDAPTISLIGNRVANVYGDNLTFAPLPRSRDTVRIDYTSGR